MKKKGFTLIELLAVIVILAVIALIATPAVLGIIEDSKKSAAEASARNIANAAKAYYMSNLMNDVTTSDIDLSNSSFAYDGNKASKGYLSYDDDGNPVGKMYVSGYCIEISKDGTLVSEKTKEDNCIIELPIELTTHTLTLAGLRYSNGEVIYYNPVTNKKCTKEESSSEAETKTGCMKWYAFLDDGSSKLKLILDHNTTNLSAWNSTDSNLTSPVDAKKQLSSDISTWNNAVKQTARFIKASEIVSITKYPNWTNNGYFLHNNSNNEYTGSAGTNKYAWLFDNTAGCTSYGCNITSSKMGTNGYWTETSLSSDSTRAWAVVYFGRFGVDNITSKPNGIRPVIEIDKSVLAETRSVVNGNTYGALPTPKQEGYVFTGWYTKENGGTKIDSDTIINLSSDTSIYAQWKTGGYLVAIEAYYPFYLSDYSIDFHLYDGTIKKVNVASYSNNKDIIVEDHVVKVVVHPSNGSTVTINESSYSFTSTGDFASIKNKTYSYTAAGTSFTITQDSSCSIYFAD